MNALAEQHARAAFANPTRGCRLYSRRMPTLKWIFGRLIDTFNPAKVWFKGKRFNLLSLNLLGLAYQTLVDYNQSQGSKSGIFVEPLIHFI